MGRQRRCVLCDRVESRYNPMSPDPEGLGPRCASGCRAIVESPPRPKAPIRHERMAYDQAFTWIKTRVQHLQRLPLNATTNAERDEEYALITALGAMKDLSGSFAPDEMIHEELPLLREE